MRAEDLQAKVAAALQLRAAADYLAPNHQAWLRHVMRWYSRNFATPLHEVYDLPLEFVFQAYFEEAIEQMSDEKRAELFAELCLTEKERAELDEAEDEVKAVGEKFVENLTDEVRKGMLKGPPPSRKRFKPGSKKPALASEKASKASPPTPPGPDIEMKFGGNLFEELGDQDPLAPPPRKLI